MQEQSALPIMRAIIAPRTLHQLCQVAHDTACSHDLQAAPCAALLQALLPPGAPRTSVPAGARCNIAVLYRMYRVA